MQETRRARLQAVIQQELSMFVPREVKDPRIPALTFTAVEVTPDAETATVYVAIFGGAYGGFDGDAPRSEEAARKRMKDCLAGLSSAQGFMRKHLSRVLTIRHVPQLYFKEDRGLENSTRVFDLLKKLESEPKMASDEVAVAKDEVAAASDADASPKDVGDDTQDDVASSKDDEK